MILPSPAGVIGGVGVTDVDSVVQLLKSNERCTSYGIPGMPNSVTLTVEPVTVI